MQSLGALGGPLAFAFSVNTHRRVVGSSLTANDRMLPFLWTPERGLRRLPTLGGDLGEAMHLNEFGRIVGNSRTAHAAIRATLWTPTPGPLLAGAAGEVADPGIAAAAEAAGDAHAALCAAARRAGARSRFGIAASRVCLAR